MIFDGKTQSQQICQALQTQMIEPKVLGIFGIGLDAVSQRYVKRKQAFGNEIGCGVELIDMPVDTDTDTAIAELESLQSQVDGVIVQLPLPAHIDRDRLLAVLEPTKDIDALTAGSIFISPIVQAVLHAIGRTIESDDKIVVIGKGFLVGMPIIRALSVTAGTVTAFDEHSDIDELRAALATATIVISGVGKPGLITPDMVQDGVIAIDVGTAVVDGQLRGDWDPACSARASVFTPTPGGIGPMVVAYLWANLIRG